jgi:hypothetical protein
MRGEPRRDRLDSRAGAESPAFPEVNLLQDTLARPLAKSTAITLRVGCPRELPVVSTSANPIADRPSDVLCVINSGITMLEGTLIHGWRDGRTRNEGRSGSKVLANTES